MECWGAAGGRSMQEAILKTNKQSLGGYVTGDINLSANERTLHLAVGQQGGDAILSGQSSGGWPGGGKGYRDQADNESGGGGGGFSAIYLETFTSATATNFDKLKTRIMVAGAGGGCTLSGSANSYFYGAGGGINGISSPKAAAGTQNSGNAFGIGGNASSYGGSGVGADTGTGGGGGGYWGGKAASSTSSSYSNGEHNGGGGSSFASGMTGCKAITETSTSSSISYRTGSDATIHYSGLKFTNASTIAGNASMPNPAAATGNITGNPNNGYIRITCKPYGN